MRQRASSRGEEVPRLGVPPQGVLLMCVLLMCALFLRYEAGREILCACGSTCAYVCVCVSSHRFEEPGGAAIVSHPRQVDGSVRRPDDRRKKSRDAKKERQREAEAQREEEIKRLKNLKKKEIEERCVQG